MKNERFYWLMHEPRDGGRPRWTVEKMAEEIGVSRPRLTDTLNNKPGRGGQIRRKAVAFFKREFATTWPEILKELGWDEAGKRLTAKNAESAEKETLHV